jgi:DNA-directed RNA polymerase subunit RPC12/RpoP
MALVCGNCGGDLALTMKADWLEVTEKTDQVVKCTDCGKYGLLATSDVGYA